jgi:hypothetical protein
MSNAMCMLCVQLAAEMGGEEDEEAAALAAAVAASNELAAPPPAATGSSPAGSAAAPATPAAPVATPVASSAPAATPASSAPAAADAGGASVDASPGLAAALAAAATASPVVLPPGGWMCDACTFINQASKVSRQVTRQGSCVCLLWSAVTDRRYFAERRSPLRNVRDPASWWRAAARGSAGASAALGWRFRFQQLRLPQLCAKLPRPLSCG